MNILVSGGTGFIGSHCCVALLEAGHSVIVVDNLANSKAEVIDQLQAINSKQIRLYQIDVTDSDLVDSLF
jgi:UDP-glucose 4-epimerase